LGERGGPGHVDRRQDLSANERRSVSVTGCRVLDRRCASLSLSFNPLVLVLASWRRVAVTWYSHRLIIFGFLPQISKTVAVGVSVQQSRSLGEQARSARMNDLAVFRYVFYDCSTLRADALFELTDAVLCADRIPSWCAPSVPAEDHVAGAIGTKSLRYTVLTMELCSSLDIAASTQVHDAARREGRFDVECGCQPERLLPADAVTVSALLKHWKRAASVSPSDRRWCHGPLCSPRDSTCSGTPSSSRAVCHGGRPG
jgi:hypothetical protein